MADHGKNQIRRQCLTIGIALVLAAGIWLLGNRHAAGRMDVMGLIEIGDIDGVRYVATWDRRQLTGERPVVPPPQRPRTDAKAPEAKQAQEARYEPVYWALRNNQLDIFRLLVALDVDFDVNQRNANGRTVLHDAVRANRRRTVQTLLKLGADANHPDSHGRTPLHDAARRGYAQCAEVLLDHGAAVDAAGGAPPRTPLEDALQAGHADVARLLLRHGATWRVPKGKNVLHQAAITGNRKLAELLVERGMDVNQMDDNERTPLHHAAGKGMVAFLVDAGAKRNARDKDGLTPLYLAAEEGRADAIRGLIAAGANPRTHNSHGARPIDYAAKAGRLEAVKAFVDAGVDVSKGPALDYAATRGQADVVHVLLANGAETTSIWPLRNAINNGHEDVALQLLQAGVSPLFTLGWDQRRPLHWAVERGNVEIVRQLIYTNVDVNVRDKYDRTPLHFADDPKIAKALLDAGANVRAQDIANGLTPLHLAAKNGNVALAKALVAAGANLDAEDETGATPLDWAVTEGHPEMVEYLEQIKAKPPAARQRKTPELLERDEALAPDAPTD